MTAADAYQADLDATAERIAAVKLVPWKKCSCGRAYTESGWYALPLAGFQECETEDGYPAAMELRNCPSCNSTMAGPETPLCVGCQTLVDHFGERCGSCRAIDRAEFYAEREADAREDR